MHALPIFLVTVLALGLAAQWLAWRLRLPAILLLLVLGFVFGWYFDDPGELLGQELLLAVVSLSVAVILFEGGLSLRLSEVRETGGVVVALVTVGIAITWLLTLLAARWILGFCWPMAALTGAILVVSGPTVVIPLLRHVRPHRKVGAIVKWEGIVNDPIGAILAIVILVTISTEGLDNPGLSTIGSLIVFLGLGAVMGVVVSLVTIQVLRRYWIPDYLQNPALLTLVVVTFLVSNLLRPESGLMAVTVFGVILANQKSVTVHHVLQFKENLRVLIISCLFIVLAARIDPNDLLVLGVPGVLFLALLVLVVRPAAALASTIRSGLALRERLFLAWIHPRGIVAAAVSSVFALELLELSHTRDLSAAIVSDAERLVPVTFLVIVGTVAVYGLTVGPVARWLKVAELNPQGVLFAGASPLVRELATVVQREGFTVLLVDLNQQNIAAARMAGLPCLWANICSEYAQEEIDLSGIGRLLAMTPNDEVNSLAVRELTELFGRAEVYQLPHKPAAIESLERLTPNLPGRVLFGKTETFDRLAALLEAGATFKVTSLTTEFDYDAFLGHNANTAVVLMILEQSGYLRIVAGDMTLSPVAGQKLISLVTNPDAEEAVPPLKEQTGESP